MILKAKIDMNEIVTLAGKGNINGEMKTTHAAFREKVNDIEMQ